MPVSDTVLGSENLVTTTGGDQRWPSVGSLADGGFVVAWQTTGQGIFAQRYDSSGAQVGAEMQVNVTPGGFVGQPSVAGLSNGGYVVSWQTENFGFTDVDIYAQQYGAAGDKIGAETLVNSTAIQYTQIQPSVTPLSDGGYLIAWMSQGQDGVGWGVFGQRFSADGAKVGAETQINTTTGNQQQEPSVAGLGDGGYVVVWESSEGDGSGMGVFAQRYDASGAKVGGETQINTTTVNDQMAASVAALADGGYVVAWESQGQDGSGWGTYAQRYDAQGVKVGGETLVNTTTTNDQMAPRIGALGDGGYLITWQSLSQDGSGWGVYAQRYDASGAKVDSETLINVSTAQNQWHPAVAGLDGGGYVVSWESIDLGLNSGDIYLRMALPEAVVGRHVVGSNKADNITVGDGSHSTSSGDDTVVAGNGTDTISAGAGDDLVHGDNAGDLLDGGAGRDTLVGDNGPDTLLGGLGDDLLTGGAGPDTFVFIGAASATDWDIVADFTRSDRIQLSNGLTIASSASDTDLTGDGALDTVLHLSDGATVVLSDFTAWQSGYVI